MTKTTKSTRIGLVCAVALATMIFSGPALASLYLPDVTPHCRASSRLEDGYELGYSAGKSLANSAWTGQGGEYNPVTGVYGVGNFDPGEIDFFRWTIIDAFLRILRPSASEYVICRYKGMVEGAFDMLAIVNPLVIGVCIIDGAFVGEFSAHMYCDMATAFDGLGIPEWIARVSLGTCGDYFEMVCDDVFDFVSTDGNNPVDPFTSLYLAINYFIPVHYLDLTGIACEPYTMIPHYYTCVATRNNVCAY
jgi:hypothetical protein